MNRTRKATIIVEHLLEKQLINREMRAEVHETVERALKEIKKEKKGLPTRRDKILKKIRKKVEAGEPVFFFQSPSVNFKTDCSLRSFLGNGNGDQSDV